MKSLALRIQSSLESLGDCLEELSAAADMVRKEEDADRDPPVSSLSLENVYAHCLKARRELQGLSVKVR